MSVETELRESLTWALTWIVGEGRMPSDVGGLPSDQEAFDKADRLVSGKQSSAELQGDVVEEARAEIIAVVESNLAWNLKAYGKAWTGEGEDTEFIVGDAAERVVADLTPLLHLEVKERLEGLERFGLRADGDHPGFSEVGPMSSGAFLRREQVLAALNQEDDRG